LSERRTAPSTSTTTRHQPLTASETETRSHYGADGRLRAYQKYDVDRTGSYMGGITSQMQGVWEEYRYDPLGRRIMVRTRGDGGMCNMTDDWHCTSSITRFVWSGDQLLWEIKDAQGNYTAVAGGRVSYTHGGGIDRPLVIMKGDTSIIPHQNWRGQFARGTYGNAAGRLTGASSDCTSYPAQNCTPIRWPGEHTTVRHETTGGSDIRNWFGGLTDGMRDASGQMYMRNRYYDPASGQFTQPDPIGLAGGLNAYGFAAGDPVSYSDPYGLCIWFWLKRCRDRTSKATAGDALHYAYHMNRVNRSPAGQEHGRILRTIGEVRDAGLGHVQELRASGWNGDQLNGYLHVFWTCSLTRELGEEEARHTANAHEQQARHGDPEQDEDERVDRANNERGFETASRSMHRSCDELARAYVEAGDYDAPRR